jgi:hypothetical protein
MRILFVILSFCLFPLLLQAESLAVLKGRVFSDDNKNGFKDNEESGLAGVCVSNGLDVAITNENGEWTLPVTQSHSVFVIKPSGYRVPVNEYQIPQHYVSLQNPGRVSPEAGRQPIHFPLYRDHKEGKKFTALFFGDTQARGMREVNYILHDAVEELIGSDAAFGVTLGDIVADDPNLFAEVSQGIGQIGIPWYNIQTSNTYI